MGIGQWTLIVIGILALRTLMSLAVPSEQSIQACMGTTGYSETRCEIELIR